MKFTLICEHEEGDVVTHEFEKEFLNDVLNRMHDFLKGCGYVFDGTLDIVPEEEMFSTIEHAEKELNEEEKKSYRNSDIDPDGRC